MKLSKKNKIIIIALGVTLGTVAISTGVYFSLSSPSTSSEDSISNLNDDHQLTQKPIEKSESETSAEKPEEKKPDETSKEKKTNDEPNSHLKEISTEIEKTPLKPNEKYDLETPPIISLSPSKEEDLKNQTVIENIPQGRNKAGNPDPLDKIYKKPADKKTTINFEGLDIEAIVKPLYERDSFIDDKKHGIQSPINYKNQVVPTVVSVKVTKELVQKNFDKVINSLRLDVSTRAVNDLIDGKYTKYSTPEGNIYQGYGRIWYDRFYRFSRLFDTDNVKNFLTQEGVDKYDTIPKPSEYLHDDLRPGSLPPRPLEKQYQIEQAEKTLEFLIKENRSENEINAARYTVESLKQELPGVEEAYKKFNEKYSFDKKIKRYKWLWKWLDYDKFKEISKDAYKFLEKGELTDPDNLYINADGTISSHGFSPIINTVLTRIERDNKELRVFSFDSKENLTPYNAENGIYPGWTKKDISNDPKFQKYDIKKTDGINFYELTRDKPIDGKLNKGLSIVIDAGNRSGYQKTLNLIKSLLADKVEVTSYRIINMGIWDQNQKFAEILQALPEHIPQLILSIDGYNTDYLIELENKKIDELILYTTKNPLKANWSLNPWAFKNTSWINTNDYNSSLTYGDQKITSRVVFNRLAFDAKDAPATDKGVDISRINYGLRMAYYVRNNEPIFQGYFGSGLDPDHSEHNNSYPTDLDLSRVPTIKSLRGLIFYDVKHQDSRPPRKLHKLILHNEDEVFQIGVSELNAANFDVFDRGPFSKPEISFSNGSTTKKLRIVGLKNEELTSEGLKNLGILLDIAKPGFSKYPIQVSDLNFGYAKKLQQVGHNVDLLDEITFT